MPCYTVGTTESYERGIDEREAAGDRLYKLGRVVEQTENGPRVTFPGGSVWQTADDARSYLVEHGLTDRFSVYGVEADWETQTMQTHLPWRDLLVDAPVFRLKPS